MKILVVTQCFYPDVYSINLIVKKLVEDGHSVTVLTGLPDYTTSKVPKEYRWFRNRKQDFLGAKVFRVSIIARHHGPIFRCLNYLSFVFFASISAMFKKWDDFDVVYVWQVSPVTMTIPAIILKKRYRKPLYLYCLDLWPESVKAMGFEENGFLFRILLRLSKYIYSQCDHIAVSSRPFFKYFESVLGIQDSIMSYIPQFASDELLNMDLEKEKNGHVDFLFIGNIGNVQDVDVIIKACNLIKDNGKWTVHLVGNGSKYSECVKLVNDFGLGKRIKFYGSCPMSETPKYYRMADACLLTLNGDNLIGSTLPGKLQTYMAAGKPILGAINGAGHEVIIESNCGDCVSAGDIEGYSKLLLSFINNPDEFRECGKNARGYFKKEFLEKKFFSTFENELLEIINCGNQGE